jgi:predicted acetyltransferase
LEVIEIENWAGGKLSFVLPLQHYPSSGTGRPAADQIWGKIFRFYLLLKLRRNSWR